MQSAGPLSHDHASWLDPLEIDNNGATKMFLFSEKNQESKAMNLMSTCSISSVYIQHLLGKHVGTCVRENKEVSVVQAWYICNTNTYNHYKCHFTDTP